MRIITYKNVLSVLSHIARENVWSWRRVGESDMRRKGRLHDVEIRGFVVIKFSTSISAWWPKDGMFPCLLMWRDAATIWLLSLVDSEMQHNFLFLVLLFSFISLLFWKKVTATCGSAHTIYGPPCTFRPTNAPLKSHLGRHNASFDGEYPYKWTRYDALNVTSVGGFTGPNKLRQLLARPRHVSFPQVSYWVPRNRSFFLPGGANAHSPPRTDSRTISSAISPRFTNISL
jgi:hypothetical protein